jgi:hypothetical protein
MNIEIAQPIKGTSNKDIIADMDKDDVKYFDLSKRSTIASIISSDIKLLYPKRIYKTSTTENKGLLTVTRIK